MEKCFLKTQKRFLIAGGILGAVLMILFGLVIAQKHFSDPDTALLFHEADAKWIRWQRPSDLFAYPPKGVVHLFRYEFDLRRPVEHAVLNLRGFRYASVFIDRQLLFATGAGPNDWKKRQQVDLGPRLVPGRHELYIKVLNDRGPPALLAHCKALGLRTDESWQVSVDGKNWVRAVSADRILPSELSRRFPRADRAFFSRLHFYIPVFIIFFAGSYALRQQDRFPWLGHLSPGAGRVRLIVMALSAAMAINNIGKIPLDVGMDVLQHYEYIQYINKNGQIPLATDGLQMFESPLFYIVSAVLYKVSAALFSADPAAERSLRVIPLLCGLMQVELCYRALRYVFPAREDLQMIGIVLGGLMPMNIYMSQVVGTEPMLGALTGIVLVMLIGLHHQSALMRREFFMLLGFFWGLALLTKFTAILLSLPLVYFCSYAMRVHLKGLEGKWGIITRRLLLTFLIAALVSGWYYIRNRMALGSFFVGGWDTARNFTWYQDPGYRTCAQLISFGEALFYPIFAGTVGFWDSFYSTLWLDGFLGGIGHFKRIPPWNYNLMLSCAWLSLLPSAAIALGMIYAFKRPLYALERGTLFAASCITIYLFAILYLFLTVPIFSTGKATYTLGLIPCYAVIGVSGIEGITRKRPALKAAVYAGFFCWAAGAYAGYFVV